LTRRQTGTGLGASHYGGGSEEAGDRQLAHPLHLPSPLSPSSRLPAEAGETTIIMITAPKSRFFLTLAACLGGCLR
jgi:hypothetical protein